MRSNVTLSRTEAACMAGVGQGPHGDDELKMLNTVNDDRWYTVEQFEQEHVIETLTKLEEGDLDDEIWGKIILMEKSTRLAKAYLRRTAVIVDGSTDEYDGTTLGYNYFESPNYDEATAEIRSKICDGVIMKVDGNGNIKAMARGFAPIIVQEWQNVTNKCYSSRIFEQRGQLKTLKDRLNGLTDQQRIEKIFDMKLFNAAIEREMSQPKPNLTSLLLKTCVRVTLVKDGICALKTPCWIMIINLVALDVLRAKIPFLLKGCEATEMETSLGYQSIIQPQMYKAQSLVTLNEAIPALRPNSRSSARLSDSLSALYQTWQNSVSKENLTMKPGKQQRSLSCDSENSLKNKEMLVKRLQQPFPTLTPSTKSSSGVSSMDIMNPIEKWCASTSKYLKDKEGYIEVDSSQHINPSSNPREVESCDPVTSVIINKDDWVEGSEMLTSKLDPGSYKEFRSYCDEINPKSIKNPSMFGEVVPVPNMISEYRPDNNVDEENPKDEKPQCLSNSKSQEALRKSKSNSPQVPIDKPEFVEKILMSSIDTMKGFSDSKKQRITKNNIQISQEKPNNIQIPHEKPSQSSKLQQSDDAASKNNNYKNRPNDVRQEQQQHVHVKKQDCNVRTLPNSSKRISWDTSESLRSGCGNTFKKKQTLSTGNPLLSTEGRGKVQLRRFPNADSYDFSNSKFSHLSMKNKGTDSRTKQLGDLSNTMQTNTGSIHRNDPLYRPVYNGTQEMFRSKDFQSPKKAMTLIDRSPQSDEKSRFMIKNREITDNDDIFINPLFVDDYRQNAQLMNKKRMLTRYDTQNLDTNFHGRSHGTFREVPSYAQMISERQFINPANVMYNKRYK